MKKKAAIQWVAVWITLFTAATYSPAQDIHYSLFNNVPLNINPALAGVFCDECYRANLRNQWRNVPVNYLTLTGSYDRKFRLKRENPKGFFGAGLVFNYDVAGDSKLSTTQLGLSGSYTRLLSKKSYLSAGLHLSGIQRAFKLDDLVFDDQWDNSKLTADRITTEAFDNTSVLYWSLGTGLNYTYIHPKKRNQLALGAGAFHLNQPDVSFFTDASGKVKLDPRYTLYGIGTFEISKNFDFLAQALGHLQGPHDEVLLGLALRFHVNHTPTKELALQLGTHWRINDAVGVPALGILYKQWEFGGTFDLNISSFQEATNSVGGPEFFVKYCIKPAVNDPYCKLCPKLL